MHSRFLTLGLVCGLAIAIQACSPAPGTTVVDGTPYQVSEDDLVYFETFTIPLSDGSFDTVSSSGSSPVLVVSGSGLNEDTPIDQLYLIAEAYCTDAGRVLTRGPDAATGQLERYSPEFDSWSLNAYCSAE